MVTSNCGILEIAQMRGPGKETKGFKKRLYMTLLIRPMVVNAIAAPKNTTRAG
jgi:hypothetical protein